MINHDNMQEQAPLFKVGADSVFTVAIQWDSEEPGFKLISPSSEVIYFFQQPGLIREGNKATLNIVDAEPGQWYFQYNKYSNNNVDIFVNTTPITISVTGLSVKATDNPDIINVSFFPCCEALRPCYYKITANYGAYSTCIAEGNAETGERVALECDISEVLNGNDYTIQVYVEGVVGNKVSSGFMLSEVLHYYNPAKEKETIKLPETELQETQTVGTTFTVVENVEKEYIDESVSPSQLFAFLIVVVIVISAYAIILIKRRR